MDKRRWRHGFSYTSIPSQGCSRAMKQAAASFSVVRLLAASPEGTPQFPGSLRPRRTACLAALRDRRVGTGSEERLVNRGVLGVVSLGLLLFAAVGDAQAEVQSDGLTEQEAARLGEEFGIVVGAVDEAIQKELGLQKPQGVAVFEVIGNSRADYAGIKVRSVIKEINKQEIRNMADFGRAIQKAMKECNFTVGTYEPADPGDPVGWGVNFHFVGCKRD